MTTTDLAAALLRDVPRYEVSTFADKENPDGVWLKYAEALAALTAALDGVDERAGQAADTMRKMAEALPSGSAIRIASFASADLITALLAQNAALRAERDELREELLDLNRKSLRKQASLQRALTAVEAERDAYRESHLHADKRLLNEKTRAAILRALESDARAQEGGGDE